MLHDPTIHTARPRLPADNPALYRDCDADAESYVCADLVADHPSCLDGAPYWKVTAVIPDIIAAKRWAGRNGIIVKMPVAEAQASYQRGRLPTELVNRAEVA
ncbi:MAG TPA: hypothetical protein PKY73_06375 [Hyphomonas sp.]|nr:hypothetical protein [Hyphomonas sp.]